MAAAWAAGQGAIWRLHAEPGKPAALQKLMRGKTITCEDRGGDRYGRRIGLCRADGEDLGAAMVRLGYAWAFVRYSRDYVAEEAEARSENLGVHGHACQPAWQWRAERR